MFYPVECFAFDLETSLVHDAENHVCIDGNLGLGDLNEANSNMAGTFIIFGMAIWVSPDAPDLISYLDAESLGQQSLSVFHLHLLADVADGHHVGVLHIVLGNAWLRVNEGPRRGLHRWLLHLG